jgi:hypothetical protein
MDFGPISPVQATDRSMAGALARPGLMGAAVSRRALLLAALTLALIASALILAPARRPPASQPGPHSFGHAQALAHRAGPSSLPLAAQAQVSGELAAGTIAYQAIRSGDGYRMANGARGLTAAFDRSGVAIAAGALSVGMSLRAIGSGSSSFPVGESSPAAHRNRVSYARAGLSEWYRNGPLGIEQGFTIARPALGVRRGSLTLTVALTGNGHATLARDGQSVTLRRGATSLTYGALVASDARGRSLHGRLGLARGKLTLQVDAARARFPLTIDPLVQQGAKLTSGEVEDEARFGTSSALSADGSTLAIGGPMDGGSQGAVWIFTRSGAQWIRQGPKLTAGETTGSPTVEECAEESLEEEGECAFGNSVALSADGNTLLVGDPSAGPTPGAAVVFTREGSAWTRRQALTGGNEAGEGRFGKSVALSADGTTALIGDPSAVFQRGGAWVFVLSGGAWTMQAALSDGEASRLAHFGRSVALSGDGNTALVGGPGDAGFVGAAWTFTRSGTTWTQQLRKLTGAGEVGSAHFGKAVALSADAGTALVGGQDDNGERGAVWTFARSGVPFSQPGAKLEPPASLGEGRFGSSLAVSGDGTFALVGAPRGVAGVGLVTVLQRSGSQWDEQPALGGSEAAGKGWAGASVALSGDGETAAIGAPRDQKRAGAAWAFSNQPAFPPPVVDDVRPGRGVGGTRVTITGGNFTDEAGKLVVMFGSIAAANVELVSAAEIHAVAPAEPAGLVHVRVGTSSGLSDISPADTFRYESSQAESVAPKSQANGTSGAVGVLGSTQSATAACRVSLRSKNMVVSLRTSAAIRLLRTGTGQCRGTVTLRFKQKGKGKRFKLKSIGSAQFSIAPGKSQVVKIRLNKLGHALFLAGHGKLNASLMVLRTSPAPKLAKAASVRLSVKKARKALTVAH